jgi:hypothetical protein
MRASVGIVVMPSVVVRDRTSPPPPANPPPQSRTRANYLPTSDAVPTSPPRTAVNTSLSAGADNNTTPQPQNTTRDAQHTQRAPRLIEYEADIVPLLLRIPPLRSELAPFLRMSNDSTHPQLQAECREALRNREQDLRLILDEYERFQPVVSALAPPRAAARSMSGTGNDDIVHRQQALDSDSDDEDDDSQDGSEDDSGYDSEDYSEDDSGDEDNDSEYDSDDYSEDGSEDDSDEYEDDMNVVYSDEALDGIIADLRELILISCGRR